MTLLADRLAVRYKGGGTYILDIILVHHHQIAHYLSTYVSIFVGAYILDKNKSQV